MRKTIIVIASILIAFIPLPRLEPPLSDISSKQVAAEVKVEAKIEVIAPVAPSQPLDNETIAWNFFIANGFNANQTAGTMGNLQQEHGFQTSDVPGGLGIAQWMGGRREALMARAGYDTIEVQLQFLLDELNSGYIYAKQAILSVNSIEDSAIIFQNQFERCNPYYCMLDKRITYGYNILAKHS